MDATKETIRDLRARTGMTQHEFAEFTHVPFRTIQNWEGGVSAPPAYVIEMLRDKVASLR